MTDLQRLLTELRSGGVRFIIGGVAATIHGSSRLTQDLDLVYARTDEPQSGKWTSHEDVCAAPPALSRDQD